MSDRLRIIRLAGWMLVLSAVVLNGCGQKAPPVAPNRLPMLGVSDLQGGLSQSTVRLAWSHSPDNTRAVGYIVLRAQASLSQPECPDCPLLFQKVDTISMSRSLRKKEHPMEFYQDVADGFRYTYNVRPYQSSGAQGPDSNFVVITYSKD